MMMMMMMMMINTFTTASNEKVQTGVSFDRTTIYSQIQYVIP